MYHMNQRLHLLFMQQMPLALGLSPHPSFDNFFGQSQELLFFLKKIPQDCQPALDSSQGFLKNTFIHIWGEAQTGKTHILQASAYYALNLGMRAVFLTPDTAVDDFIFHHQSAIYCIDDVDAMNADQQTAVFNLFNEARVHTQSAIITSTKQAVPHLIMMRDDLRTRLAWGLSYGLQPLQAPEKRAWLLQALVDKNIVLDDDSIDYLLSSDFNSVRHLKKLLDIIDHMSLVQKKRLSLSFVRKTLLALQPSIAHAA